MQQQETPTWEQEEQEEMTTGAHEEQEEEEEEEEEEEDEDDGAPPDIWQRGPSQLPNRSIFIDHRTLIRPRGQKYVSKHYFDIPYVQIHNMNY